MANEANGEIRPERYWPMVVVAMLVVFAAAALEFMTIVEEFQTFRTRPHRARSATPQSHSLRYNTRPLRNDARTYPVNCGGPSPVRGRTSRDTTSGRLGA
jgi:hypothetical protein